MKKQVTIFLEEKQIGELKKESDWRQVGISIIAREIILQHLRNKKEEK